VSNLRDIRTPADPEDFESLYDRAAKPPRDFKVTKGLTDTVCIFKFQDYSGIPSRDPTVSYRAYFVPATVATAREMGLLARRQAALQIGRLVASVPATGKGEWLEISSPDPVATPGGFFLACGINRRGIESEPTIAYPNPYVIVP
jgi:hypothetical protein